MPKQPTSSLLASPLVTLALFMVLAATALIYYRMTRPPLAPLIAGYPLAQKRNVLVVGYALGCSCDLTAPRLLEEALRQKMPVLIVCDNQRAELREIKSAYEKKGAVVLLGVATNIMQTFCPHGITTYSLVDHGYILHRKQAAANLDEVLNGPTI